MKKTIYKNEFIDTMIDIRPGNFSYDGLVALFDYLEEIEDNCGEEMEFDPIALCCDFTEYDILDWVREQFTDDEIDEVIDLLVDDYEDFMVNYEPFESIDDVEYDMVDYEAVRDYIEYRTQFIPVNNQTFIIQDY